MPEKDFPVLVKYASFPCSEQPDENRLDGQLLLPEQAANTVQ